MNKCLALSVFSFGAGLAHAQENPVDRSILPIIEPILPKSAVLDARNAQAPPRFEVKAPEGAPNVIIILIDDMGFGQPSTFGGPVRMPTADRLAREGVRFNQFHTTAVCSATRTALLTGRNHHMNNMGGTAETSTANPGMTGSRPQNVGPLAETLRPCLPEVISSHYNINNEYLYFM